MTDSRPLSARVMGAFVWVAAFAFAAGIYQALTMLLRDLPATEAVAIGVVTIERYSKLKDYAGAALFFLLVPPLTLWLQRVFTGALGSLHRRLPSAAHGSRTLLAFLFCAPYLLAPFFYLTTGKAGWILFLPIVLSVSLPRLLIFWHSRAWVRKLFVPALRPFHALLGVEALSWIVYRYLVTGRRIAHIPTLFLEIVFVLLFLALFWSVALLIVRISNVSFGADPAALFRRITIAAIPFFSLPAIAVLWVPTPRPRVIAVCVIALCVLLALRLRRTPSPLSVWRLVAFGLVPFLIYVASYASTASLTQWIDLFHRGEAIGPASDYLRGKVAYREVFVLHGLLEDGLLDSWLMRIFGRSLDVAVIRPVILGAFLGPLIWYLGMVIFRSIPLAFLCVMMGAWTTAENNRTFLQVGAVALFLHALLRRRTWPAFISGVLAGVSLFHSYEIGLYTVAGAFAVVVMLFIVARRVRWDGLPPSRAAAFFGAGALTGAAPFLIYLAINGALDDFAITSFVTIPRIIDAVWSLPFPDLVSTFRKNLNLHTIAEFVLWEKFHLILSPLTIAVSAIYCIHRWLARRTDALDHTLAVLTVFATIAQRTAFGRAEFRHQYFAAFLIGPMLVILALLLVRRLRMISKDAGSGVSGEGTRAFVVALVVCALPVIAVIFWIPDLVNARINDLAKYQARVLRIEKDEAAEQVQWRIRTVSEEIQRLTRPNEPIFDFSNQPAFYFFANRPNPTRFYQVPIFSPSEFQSEVIADLERAKPRVILRRSPEGFDQFDGVTNDLRAQAVSAYIDDLYTFHRSLRGVELWVRNPAARPRPMAKYVRLIRVPAKTDLVFGAIHRVVFPAVGSVAGAGGSYWQSDLTLHNPRRDPMPVTLRFVAGERRIDRRLTLAPRQTLHWTDVVRQLFGRDGVGTLWVEHRENRAPVAVIKTADVAHGGRASVERPLSQRDAVTANSDAAELTIVGIPPGPQEGRRVNIGVVNLGIIPCTFRVSARTRDGKTVGRELESGIPEDEVWLLSDIERQLGVRLDDGVTLRLTAIAGTGAGFATIADSRGDTEFIPAIPSQQQ